MQQFCLKNWQEVNDVVDNSCFAVDRTRYIPIGNGHMKYDMKIKRCCGVEQSVNFIRNQ